jgi:hypothetical protein
MYVASSASDAPKLSVEMHQVQLTGLPNEILSDMMFEAVLQQAHLNGAYVSYTTCLGKHHGEAVVNLNSASAAEWCAHHFHDRSWMADGTAVVAQLLPSSAPEQEALADDLSTEVWEQADEFDYGAWNFSADAAVFDPSQFQEVHGTSGAFEYDCNFGVELERPLPGGFSVDAPAFVPTPVAPARLSAKAPVFVPGKSGDKSTNNSDVSTVDGESESDEEKEGAAIEAAAC